MRALYAYFMHGVQPGPHQPPETGVAFPVQPALGAGFLGPGVRAARAYRPRHGRDAQWNRGAYLVQALGHCGACHTPRGPAFEERGYDETSTSLSDRRR